jgi:hypothetical protein
MRSFETAARGLLQDEGRDWWFAAKNSALMVRSRAKARRLEPWPRIRAVHPSFETAAQDRDLLRMRLIMQIQCAVVRDRGSSDEATLLALAR